jgi:VanZ family protein
MPRVSSFAFRVFAWLPVVLCMGVIFSASCDAASFQHTSRLLVPLLHWLFPHLSAEATHEALVLIRKGGHVTEFALLAVVVYRAFRLTASGEVQPQPGGSWLFSGSSWFWHPATALRSLAFVFLYACSDEFHQAFVPSREASFGDVLIDTSGALLFFLAIYWRSPRAISEA